MATISAPIPIAQTAASKFASEELAKLATPPPSPPVFSAVNGALTTTGEDEMSITEKLEKLGVKWVRIGMLNVNNLLISVSTPLFRLPKLSLTGIGKPYALFQQPIVADVLVPGTGVGATGELNFIPDMESLRLLPYEEGVAFVIGEVWDHNGPSSKVRSEVCPRSTLKKQLSLLKSKYGYEPIVGMEVEFVMYDGFNADGTLKQLDQFVYCQDEAFRTKGGKVLREIAETLMSVGVTPYTFHPESAPGCYEMSLAPVPMLKAADDLLFLRQTISAVCNKYGIQYTLLPKPLAVEQGNGLHIHMSLIDSTTGKNVFPDSTSPIGLSQPAQHFLAGIMAHLPAIAGLTLPTVNSYARANAQGFWSGCHAVTWGRENRETTCRIASPPYGNKCDNVEIRAYDSTANPYLGLAAFVACGMDGLEKKMEMPPETVGDPAEAKHALPMPKTLSAAIENLSKDEVLKEMLGEMGMLYNVEMRKYEVEYMSKLSFEDQVKLYVQKF